MKKIKTFTEFFNVEPIMENWSNLITESLDNKFTVVCVSVNSKNSTEIQYLRSACTSQGVNFIHIDFTKKHTFIKTVNGNCVLCDGEIMYELDKTKTVILKRHAHMSDTRVSHNLNILKNNDFLIINSTVSTQISSDKVRTLKKFDADHIPHPKSLILDESNIEDFDNTMSEFNVEFPVIAKVNRGSQGNGVFLFDNKQSLKGVAQYIISHQDGLPCNSIIVQEKIDAEYDLRIHVIRKESDPVFRTGDHYEVFAAMKRNKLHDDYRSNASLGAEYEYYKPKEDEIELAKKAAASMKCGWCGVDIIRDKNTNKLYVLEVNCTPSLKGISKVSPSDPATDVIRILKEAFERHGINSKKEKITLGYKETFYIDDFKIPLVGLLDTGNGSLTSLRVENIKVDKENKTVKWELLGKTFETKYDGLTSYRSSSGERVHQPTTRVNITHNGVTYKNIRIKLSDIKGNKHIDKRVLNINRDLLTKMNAVVDTSKKHVNDTMHDISSRTETIK